MRQIEELRTEKAVRANSASLVSRPEFRVRAGLFSDERAAATTLTRLIDAGYDGALISSQADGVLLFEIQLGPYDDIEVAQRTFEILRDAYGLDPAVTVVEPEGP